MINPDFWNGKKVFITGHTGFKGTWLSLWLTQMGANVSGYSLAPATEPNLFEIVNIKNKINYTIGDVRDLNTLKRSLIHSDPEIIFHMAAQPLVRKSYRDPVDTYSTNVMGTVNLLEASRDLKNLKTIINVTTDKVYENKELDKPFKEIDNLGGFDPYSNSKACSELVTSSFRSSFYHGTGVKIVTARAGNVIGGGDWSEDRLIPDIIRAYSSSNPVFIRNPNAIRPWQHVLESLTGYLKLAEFLDSTLNDYPLSWNFGPNPNDFLKVSDIINLLKDLTPLIKFEVKEEALHEAQILKLDNTQARTLLGWSSRWDVKHTIQKTFSWYMEYLRGEDPLKLCLKQIEEFSK